MTSKTVKIPQIVRVHSGYGKGNPGGQKKPMPIRGFYIYPDYDQDDNIIPFDPTCTEVIFCSGDKLANMEWSPRIGLFWGRLNWVMVPNQKQLDKFTKFTDTNPTGVALW